MTPDEFEEVKEFIFDHYEHFDCYPGEVETLDGNVYTIEEYLKFLD